jgi:HD-like signal output (HDOD) protein
MSLDTFADYATESFTMPEVCIKLRAMLDSGKTDIDDIAELITIDPSLSAKVLRLANSALFRFPRQIETTSKAISVIGGEALYNIVMAETASIAFKHFDSHLVNIDTHWHSSVYCGVAAQNVARRMKIRASERFFVMGILQGLATLVIAKHAPNQFAKTTALDSKGLPWDIQRSIFGFTFAQCSGLILEQWCLPMPLYYPIQHMHEKVKVKSDVDVCIMTFADQISTSQIEKQRYASRVLWADNTQIELSLDEQQIKDIIDETEKDTARIASTLLA